MSSNPSQVGSLTRESRGSGTLRLHERICEDLKDKFRDRSVEQNARDFAPDFVIRGDDRVAVIEINTGDPTLPLPSSANTRMLNLRDGAVKLGLAGDVVPVLVTNYRLDEADRKELESGGIKIITIEEPTYNTDTFSAQLEEIMAQA